MIILLHSSKTMRPRPHGADLRQPQLIEKAKRLAAYLKTLNNKQIAKAMGLSETLANKTVQQISDWGTDQSKLSLAIDAFIGDIYSGLQASELSKSDRDYADQHLRILSGLYGVIRPYDGICPYRLEMGYSFPKPEFTDLPKFWGASIADTLPKNGLIINASAVEYTQAVLPYVNKSRVITPKFLTANPKTGEPTFIVVHAKIARGAFARWVIQNRAEDASSLQNFDGLGYKYDQKLSTPEEPVFICRDFGGKGLSIRLK